MCQSTVSDGRFCFIARRQQGRRALGAAVSGARSGALMHLLGVLEVSSGSHFEATHVRGIHDAAADGISRLRS